MSKSNTCENAILKLIFTAVDWENIAENDSTSPLTNLYVSLHTADPGEAGNQPSNETEYTNYARVAVARTNAGWTVTTNPSSVSPAANIDFAECGVTPGAAITHFGIGATAIGGASTLYYSGTVTPNITMAAGVIPRLKTTSTITED